MVADHVRPWRGVGYRHVPVGSRIGVLDTRYAGLSGENRWNVAGEPTLYLAGDVGVAVAEFARHYRERRTARLELRRTERALYRLDLRVAAALDLRLPTVRSALGLRGGPSRFLDISVARAVAHYVRATTSAEALIVPSIAFLDDPSRWNLALFLEKLPEDLTTFIGVTREGTLTLMS